MRMLRQMLPLLAAVAGLLVLFRVWVPEFLAPDNMLDLAQQISVNAIIAFGMTLVILTGGIDLSVGALVALVGTTTVYGLIALGGTDAPSAAGVVAAMLLGLGAAAAVGLVNGLCAARTRMPPFIITLATMLVARGAALRFNEGRPMHIPEVHTLFLWLGNGRVGCVVPVPVPVLVLRHDRRRVVHFNVTTSPTAQWAAQQIVEAFPFEEAPRFLLRDGIYGEYFRDRVEHMGIDEVLIAPRSPWQNPYCERLIGSVRRECLDHVIVLNEDHLRRTLSEFFTYYHESRTHLSLDRNSPIPRSAQLPAEGKVVAKAYLGGLHHRYTRAA